jgi:NAD(P)H-flavin reductase
LWYLQGENGCPLGKNFLLLIASGCGIFPGIPILKIKKLCLNFTYLLKKFYAKRSKYFLPQNTEFTERNVDDFFSVDSVVDINKGDKLWVFKL